MGPRRCVVETCESISGKQQHRGVTFHTFPLNPVVRKVWIKNSRVPSTKTITKSTLICSRHFRRADFQPLKNNKYLLITGAVPTIFTWGSLPYTELTTTAAPIDQDLNIMTPTTPTPKNAPVDDDPDKTKIVRQILVDAVKSEIKSPVKRSASADVKPGLNEPQKKIVRKSLDSAVGKNHTKVGNKLNISTDPAVLFVPGAKIEAQGFNEIWHSAKVVEVDADDREVLIHFEKMAKGYVVEIE